MKRGEGWIEARPRKNGATAHVARWYDDSGRVRGRAFRSRDDAEDHLRQTARAKRDGRYRDVGETTVHDAVLAYIERGQSRWKASTSATYRQRAYAHIVPGLGHVRLVELTPARVQHWIDRACRDGTGAKILQEATRLLSGAMSEATRLGMLRHNPVSGVRLPKAEPKGHRIWDAGQIAAVLETVKDEPMWHALYRVGLMTGMRPGELRGLQWPDVDLDAATVTIRRTITRGLDNREVLGTTTKTGRVRSVAIPASTVAALRAWRIDQATHQLAAQTWDDRRFVFTGQHGQFLGATTWQRYQADLAERAGVPAIGLHSLRHSVATALLAQNAHPLLVSRLLGHSKIATTLDLYSHPDTAMQRTMIDDLAERIEGDNRR